MREETKAKAETADTPVQEEIARESALGDDLAALCRVVSNLVQPQLTEGR